MGEPPHRWAAIYGVAQSQTRLKWLSSSSSSNSRLVITFLPRSKHLLISWLQSPSAVILELKKIVSHCFPIYLLWSDGTGGHEQGYQNPFLDSKPPVPAARFLPWAAGLPTTIPHSAFTGLTHQWPSIFFWESGCCVLSSASTAFLCWGFKLCSLHPFPLCPLISLWPHLYTTS